MADTIYTQAAQEFAESHEGGLPALKATVEMEIEDLLHGGLDDIMNLFFHTFSWHGKHNFIMSPHQEQLVVDLVDKDDAEPIHIESGPLAGKTVTVPRPFTKK